MPVAAEIAQWKVLIIDDEPDNINVVEFIFDFHGAHLTRASNGIDGLDMMKKERPTFLLLDIQMPKMTGWDVLKAIREDESLKDMTVIALTAHAMEGDKERALAAGFDGYMTKPISPMTFMTDLKTLVAGESKPNE
jgi:CheY-like chemotaxis protein